MHLHKHDVNNLRIPARQTRGADRAQFKVEKYNVCKYKNSPFYKGADLWQLLPHNIVLNVTVHQFKTLLKSRYKVYVDTTAKIACYPQGVLSTMDCLVMIFPANLVKYTTQTDYHTRGHCITRA